MRRDPGLIFANLGCENDWAPSSARRGLSARAMCTAVACATTLRAFALPGDKLWVPGPVEDLVLPQAPGLEEVELIGGRLRGLSFAHVLAWGETEAAQAIRKRARRVPGGLDGPLGEVLWRAPAPGVEAARSANDRRFALECSRSLGCALEGAAVIGTITELRTWLDRELPGRSTGDAWVLKAPYSSSGRERVQGAGQKLPASLEGRIASLLGRFGGLICEPWMDRTADFGVCAILGEESLRALPPHRLEVDSHGAFLGIALRPGAPGDCGLEPLELTELQRVVEGVAIRLRALGYCGPFGIDCWRWRDLSGAVRFHPLGEINARMSFGLVARALAERLEAAGEMAAQSGLFRMRVGDVEAMRRAREASGARVIPLVESRESPEVAAWIELQG